MGERLQALTEKEKETLRLIVRGYDAKALARHFGLSVHTINERLRHARRKLEVPSSREAARLLFEQEEGHPQSLADKDLGAAQHAAAGARAEERKARPVRAWLIGGFAMSLLLATILLSSAPHGAQSPPAPVALAPRAETDSAALARSPQVAAALEWLALVDQGRWDASYAATGEAFRRLNTSKAWADVNETVRVPLGNVVARRPASEETVPAPPAGYQMVKFETTFANEATALETLTLAREGGGWKVVGYLID